MGDALAPAPRSSFARYWTAAALSSFSSAVTAVAMPVLVVQLLGATPLEVGVVNAAQFVPYALRGRSESVSHQLSPSCVRTRQCCR